MDKPHYNLVIATPGSSMDSEYVKSLMTTTQELNSAGISYTFLNQYSSFVPAARELTAIGQYSNDWKTTEIGAGKFTYDVVIWIDSDVRWSFEDIMTLYTSDKPIISGMCQTTPNGLIGAHWLGEDDLPVTINKVELLLADEPVKVGGVGLAFVAMKSGVFESIQRPWFLVRRIKWPDIDFYTMVGEDYSFCAAARDAGYEIWLHPQVKVDHIKQTAYVI